jgi:rare lipoprotein A
MRPSRLRGSAGPTPGRRLWTRGPCWAWLALAGVIAIACGRDHTPRAPEDLPRRGPPVGCSDADLAAPARDVQEGLATYYADSLSGNHTANGERYDPRRLTAAHRTLPFGTRLRVTRTDVSAPVLCVRVNDRGPYSGHGKVLDLSRRGAEGLHMIRAGVVPVRIEIL